MDIKALRNKRIVVTLSLLLIFMVIPHVLEDFALGEPAKNGVPELLLLVIVASLIALQALGLYFLGGEHRYGYYFQILVGLVWPLLAGSAQLPIILTTYPYRSGFSSIFFVIGVIVIGVLLFFASLHGSRGTLRHKNKY